MIGKLAVSKSGHDKGNIYVIVKEEEANVYIVDGQLRTMENPKRKNKKHIQIIKKLPKEITELLIQDRNFRNEEIKRAIKLYNSTLRKRKNQSEYNYQEV